jgi:hypothetical protein
MYLGDFVEYLHHYRIGNGCAIGINPYSEEWERLYWQLARDGRKGIDGDFSEFDAHQAAIIHQMNLKHIVEPYYQGTEEEARVRRNILFSVTHSIHITNPDYSVDEIIELLTEQNNRIPTQEEVVAYLQNNRRAGAIVYQLESGMPSGSYLTGPFNSLYNDTSCRVAFVVASKEPAWHAMDLYEDNVEHVDFGDDGVFSVTETVAPYFNQNTMAEAFKELDMKFTPASKDESILPDTRPIDQLSFLKRTFRMEKDLGRWLAPLDLDTILEMPYWTKRSVDDEQITRDNVDNALEELALHGEQVYRYYSEKIIAASIDRLHYTPRTINYHPNLMRVIHREYY